MRQLIAYLFAVLASVSLPAGAVEVSFTPVADGVSPMSVKPARAAMTTRG